MRDKREIKDRKKVENRMNKHYIAIFLENSEYIGIEENLFTTKEEVLNHFKNLGFMIDEGASVPGSSFDFVLPEEYPNNIRSRIVVETISLNDKKQ